MERERTFSNCDLLTSERMIVSTRYLRLSIRVSVLLLIDLIECQQVVDYG
jgi:hypothetical protein